MNAFTQNARSKIAKWALCAHHVVKAVEPWGIIVAIIGFLITLIQLGADRDVREATLIGLTSDRLEAAREMDENEDKIAHNNVGQIRMLEIVAKSKRGFDHMNLSSVYLRGVELEKSDLKNVNFMCSELQRANLSGSDLSEADLRSSNLFKTKLRDVNFTKADLRGASFLFNKDISEKTDFSDANFNDTRLKKLDLRRASGLTDEQVSEACGQDVMFPDHITVELKECTQEQRKIQNCERHEKRETENQKTHRILRQIRTEVRKIRTELTEVRKIRTELR